MKPLLRLRGDFLRLGCLLIALGLLPGVAMARAVKETRDVVFGTAEGKKQLLDVYQPEGFTGKRPGVILVHGGGWMFGDKGFYAPFARHLAEKGFVAFSVNYRLAPASHYPAQVDDVQRAVRWIRAHAADYNLDTERLGALGDSAGGHLVAMLGTRDTRDNSDTDLASYSSRVQCVVDFYGPTDFTLPPSNGSKDGLSILKSFFGKAPEEAPELYRDGSPIVYVSTTSAPFLIIHGTADPLVPVDQSVRLYDALKKVGVDVTLVLLHQYKHGFLTPADPKESGALAEDFLLRRLKP